LGISNNGGSNFTNYTDTTGLGANNVRGVYAIGSTIYAATDGGLSISSNGGTSFTNYTTTNGLGSNSVNGVYAIGSTIYAATNGGLGISLVTAVRRWTMYLPRRRRISSRPQIRTRIWSRHSMSWQTT
jgi:hypothetical protein